MAVLLLGGAVLTATTPARAQKIDLKSLAGEAIKGAAIGYAVKQSAKPLNQFINAITLRQKVRDTQTTKVVPMLSLGDKGYIGAAQVSGPYQLINKTQAVWQVEGSKQWGDGVYRIKALVPSDSLNPLKLRRVQKVGVSAVIDVATDGPLRREGPFSRSLGVGDVIKAGAIAVAVSAASKPLNTFVNTITFNRNALATKVVPLATFGEKAYVGGGQLSGSTTTLPKARALWQYEDLFDRGRFRVKILVPTEGVNPLKLRRVPGVGLTALIDTSIQRQAATLAPSNSSRDPLLGGLGGLLGDRKEAEKATQTGSSIGRDLPPGIAKKLGLGKHDNGKSKGQKRGDDKDD